MKSKERYAKEYEKYIRSSEWTIKKNQRKDIDNHKCVMCERSEGVIRGGLQVHHISYRHLGNEDVYTELVSLCPTCHRRLHNLYKRKINP